MYIDFWFIQSNYCELFHCIFSPFPLHLHADRSATRYSHPNKIIWYIFGYQNAKRISTLKVTFYPTTCFIILLFLSVMPLLQSSYLVDPPQQKSLVSPSLGTRPSADHSLLSVSSPQRPEDNRDQETMFWSQSHTPLIQQRYMRCFKINEPILPKYTRVVLHHLGEAPIVVDHRPPRVSSHPFVHQDKKHFLAPACALFCFFKLIISDLWMTLQMSTGWWQWSHIATPRLSCHQTHPGAGGCPGSWWRRQHPRWSPRLGHQWQDGGGRR